MGVLEYVQREGYSERFGDRPMQNAAMRVLGSVVASTMLSDGGSSVKGAVCYDRRRTGGSQLVSVCFFDANHKTSFAKLRLRSGAVLLSSRPTKSHAAFIEPSMEGRIASQKIRLASTSHP